jgi:hypothetical protein
MIANYTVVLTVACTTAVASRIFSKMVHCIFYKNNKVKLVKNKKLFHQFVSIICKTMESPFDMNYLKKIFVAYFELCV